MKKYLAEVFGTFVLVFFGCGTAVVTGGFTGGLELGYLGVVGISLAFGFTIVAAAYAIGHISGGHLNPAVSLAMLIDGRINLSDFIGYVIAQIIGAIAASGIFSFIVKSTKTLSGYGANGYGSNSAVGINMTGAVVVEIVLTFVFVMTILAVTARKDTSSIAPIVIGFTLTLVHLIGIPLTGTSVNPARSIAPAIFTGGEALSQLPVFIIAPLVGASLAAIIYKSLFKVKE